MESEFAGENSNLHCRLRRFGLGRSIVSRASKLRDELLNGEIGAAWFLLARKLRAPGRDSQSGNSAATTILC
jgi:hypothetical protein